MKSKEALSSQILRSLPAALKKLGDTYDMMLAGIVGFAGLNQL
jgi:hypothetical protein